MPRSSSGSSLSKREDLRSELLAMAAADARARTAFIEGVKAGDLTEDDPRRSRFTELDLLHTVRLREIVDEVGWPGRSLAGEDGAEAAWYVAQHADEDPAFQRRCLDLMVAMVDGEVTPLHVGMLTDRVHLHEGKLEVLGTQGGEVEDPDTVDERRAALGLKPLAETRAGLRRVQYRDGKAFLGEHPANKLVDPGSSGAESRKESSCISAGAGRAAPDRAYVAAAPRTRLCCCGARLAALDLCKCWSFELRAGSRARTRPSGS